MRFVFLLVLLSPLLATAGNAPAGAPCSNPNQCLSHTCSQKRCAPSTDYPAGLGGFCSTNGTCKSKNCVRSKCEAPKEEKKTSSSSTGGGSPSTPRDDDEEEETEAPKAKEPEPLPEPTPCSEDLIATVYKGDNSRTHQFYARDNCKYPPEELEKAKKLFLDGYGYNFAITLSTVHNATPEQLACAIKHYDKRKNGRFDVPHLCLQKNALIACTEELTPLLKDEMQAQIACERRSPEVISKTKPIFLEKKYGDSFDNIADTVEKTTPEQLECVKRDFAYRSNGFTKYVPFTQLGVCLHDPPAIDCYFDLLGGIVNDTSSDERFRSSLDSECTHSGAEAFALAKQMGRGTRTSWEYLRLVSDIDDMKPEQQACVAKLKLSKLPEKDRNIDYLRKTCPIKKK